MWCECGRATRPGDWLCPECRATKKKLRKAALNSHPCRDCTEENCRCCNLKDERLGKFKPEMFYFEYEPPKPEIHFKYEPPIIYDKSGYDHNNVVCRACMREINCVGCPQTKIWRTTDEKDND